MKKTDIFFNWLSNRFKSLVPTDDVNINENEVQIMKLLTESNYTKLTTEQQFYLYHRIQNNFKKIMDEKKESALNDLDLIENDGYKLIGTEPFILNLDVKEPEFVQP